MIQAMALFLVAPAKVGVSETVSYKIFAKKKIAKEIHMIGVQLKCSALSRDTHSTNSESFAWSSDEGYNRSPFRLLSYSLHHHLTPSDADASLSKSLALTHSLVSSLSQTLLCDYVDWPYANRMPSHKE